uniref:Putative secreted protein n=1 Tax=Anopheles darlingi TaxID=43151 RepID=A0A2M4DHN0_ANODA
MFPSATACSFVLIVLSLIHQLVLHPVQHFAAADGKLTSFNDLTLSRGLCIVFSTSNSTWVILSDEGETIAQERYNKSSDLLGGHSHKISSTTGLQSPHHLSAMTLCWKD